MTCRPVSDNGIFKTTLEDEGHGAILSAAQDNCFLTFANKPDVQL